MVRRPPKLGALRPTSMQGGTPTSARNERHKFQLEATPIESWRPHLRCRARIGLCCNWLSGGESDFSTEKLQIVRSTRIGNQRSQMNIAVGNIESASPVAPWNFVLPRPREPARIKIGA